MYIILYYIIYIYYTILYYILYTIYNIIEYYILYYIYIIDGRYVRNGVGGDALADGPEPRARSPENAGAILEGVFI